MTALAEFLRDELARGRAAWSLDPLVAEAVRPGRVTADGRELLVLCANDYLGLAADPRVVEAARAAAARFGAGARAARSLGGDTVVHRRLEEELAAFKGTEAALLFGSGFACNVGAIAALVRKGDLVLSDALNHASIVDGCRLSGAEVVVYRHCNAAHLAELLAERGRAADKTMVVTDAVFSMDGDVTPLPELLGAAAPAGAFVMLDEAHATGVLGPGGHGTLAHFGLASGVDVLMGTLGKALGSVGGFIAGSRDLVDYLARSARSFLFTTALPAPAAAAALEALRILRAEPERVERLRANARRLHEGLSRLGFVLSPEPGAIVPVHFGDDAAASGMARRLLELGVVVSAVGPPYVAAGTSRLRVIVSAAHDAADIDLVLHRFAEAAAMLDMAGSASMKHGSDE